MPDRLQNMLTAILTLTAVSIGVVLVHREFYSGQIARSGVGDLGPPTYLSNWNNMVAGGRVVGDPGARVKLIEFSDLECPVCRQFDRMVREVRKKYPKDVALVFVHFPLPQHRFARPAARAAECVNQAGRFAEFVALVYEKQDSLGFKPWASFAREAQVADTARFVRCVADTIAVAAIESGVALGKKLGIHGTPTVVVNGWRFRSPPSEADLVQTVTAILAGERPFSDGESNARSKP